MNKLVEALEKIVQLSYTSEGFAISAEVLRIAKEALQEHAANKEGWVRVEDELPLTNKNVLLWATDKGIGEAIKGKRTRHGVYHIYFTICGMQLANVTHWQPLPTPPKP